MRDAMRLTLALAVVALLLGHVTGPEARADADSTATLRARAFHAAYNLDYPETLELLDQALARDPNDSATHRQRAAAVWLHILFRRGSIVVDQYLGGMRRSDVPTGKPPPEDTAAFDRHAARALELADQRLAAHPNDVQALYDSGAVVGIMASYGATVDGRILGSFRQARRAFDTHERVLALDPSRKDAGLIVGTYRYIISTLNLPMRWMAYVAGFGGDRALGIRMVEEAARYSSEAQTDAKVALVLFYNREQRYGDALAMTRDLMARYPRNRLLWLEAGATAIRGGKFEEGERLLNDGLARFEGDTRPRAFGETALWYYKRGMARVALRKLGDAGSDLRRARGEPAHEWVTGRVELELGKLADLLARRDEAIRAYQEALRFAALGNDDDTSDRARQLLKTPYR